MGGVEVNDSSAGRELAVYEWNAWNRFLLPAVFPACQRLEADWRDVAAAVLGRLDDGIRAFLFQVNLSRTGRYPVERRQLVDGLEERGVKVLNRELDDIRKSRLHVLLEKAGLPSAKAPREGDDDEYLMLKTDLNYGGRYERGLEKEERLALGLGGNEIPLADWSDYRVVPRCEIPDACWEMPGLVVERWVRNPDDRFYRAYVGGERLVVVKAVDEQPIQKVGASPGNLNILLDRRRLAELEHSDHLPTPLIHTLRRFFCHVPLEFGCIDILYDDQGYFVVDLNTTPYGGKALPQEVLEHLRGGFEFA